MVSSRNSVVRSVLYVERTWNAFEKRDFYIRKLDLRGKLWVNFFSESYSTVGVIEKYVEYVKVRGQKKIWN